MKIVILDGYTLNPGDLDWNGLLKFGWYEVYDRTPIDDIGEIIKRIGDSEIILTNKTPLTKEVFDACPKLKYVGVLATGYNIIDIQAAKENQVTVTNIPTYGTRAVAQFSMALLLEICNKVEHHNRAVKEGRWSKNQDFCFWDYPLIQLEGKTIGLLGFGRIGQAMGEISKAMGMKVIAYDQYPNDAGEKIGEYVTLDELFAKADIISLHCPLLEDTIGIINKNNIEKMKDGVIILNNSRGPLIIEKDLAQALNSGKVLGAGLDVVSVEPINENNPLLKAANCIITPHISWAARETRVKLLDIGIDNLEAFLEGKPINVVNL